MIGNIDFQYQSSVIGGLIIGAREIFSMKKVDTNLALINKLYFSPTVGKLKYSAKSKKLFFI